ncbi:MAG: hypothetical protein M1556_01460 [Candidatus Thermoplasmatota archaeon]|jgi:hypothetical protein|nr:hypothetical protein [Candidatus Thermoplasmatota archaeon]MCL6002303.1 hypothetical protein [Candidatus Thermoplasmatota archaeon]
MTCYSCKLHFGTLDIEGIEADNEDDARQKAMERFRDALTSVDKSSINVNVKETEPLPVIRDPKIDPKFFKLRKKRRVKRKTKREVCLEIARIAELEVSDL